MFFKPNAVTRSALLWGLKTALVIGALILPAAYAENACGAKASQPKRQERRYWRHGCPCTARQPAG